MAVLGLPAFLDSNANSLVLEINVSPFEIHQFPASWAPKVANILASTGRELTRKQNQPACYVSAACLCYAADTLPFTAKSTRQHLGWCDMEDNI